MDPLTHTLVGANLAATRLGTTTRFAAAALVIGANLPDVDSILYFTGHDDLALQVRRGWTHGVLALVVLPFVQTTLLMLCDRLRPDPARGVRPRWLLFLSFLAILTHPTLDWLNSYGMRWLMPFDGTWFYGDAVYIMDPWLWLILGCGLLLGRRPTPALFVAWLFCSGAIAWVAGRRSPEYLPLIAAVAIVLLIAMLVPARRSFAGIALMLAFAYIGARLVIQRATAMEVRRRMAGVERMMAAPHPIDPLRWDVVAQTGGFYRYGRFTWRDRRLALDPLHLPLPKETREWAVARRDPSIRGFIGWARFPWYEIVRNPRETRVIVHDARYASRRRKDGTFGGVSVVVK